MEGSAKEKITILIVEDHVITAHGLAGALNAEQDMEVVGVAGYAEQGLQLAKETEPEVVLLDLHLPDSKGPRSLLNAFNGLCKSGIIVFTGEERDILVEAIIDAGADAYLHKTASFEKIFSTIRQVFEGVRTTTPADGSTSITGAEKHVLRLLSAGACYADIAERRGTSISTVKKQCEKLQEKLLLNSREELIAWSVAQGYGCLD